MTYAYFVAVDFDPDGVSTAFYRVRTSAPVEGDTMPPRLWDRVFGGSHYFNPDDLFVIPRERAQRDLELAGASFSDHGPYEYASIKGYPASYH
jgi:hypothetical protein